MMKKWIAYLLMTVMLFSLAACASSGAEVSKYPPGYEEYVSVLAMRKEDAGQRLNLSDSDMEQLGRGFNATGKTASFCGTEFDVNLYIWAMEENHYRFAGFAYEKSLGTDQKAAAETISKIANTFTETYGKSKDYYAQADEERFADMSVTELETWLSNAREGVYLDNWAIQSLTTEAAAECMSWLQANSPYPTMLLENLQFYVEMSVSKYENGEIYLRLFYQITQNEYLAA